VALTRECLALPDMRNAFVGYVPEDVILAWFSRASPGLNPLIGMTLAHPGGRY
jgi:hypothetical protein